jgi:DNA-binding Lrp family transcriptional regulator
MALDRIDFVIIAELQNNARLSNKELAARVGLAPSSCLQRVRDLTREGVLKGHHAEIAPAALGIGVEALVAVRLVKHAKETFRRLYGHLLALPEVLAIFHVSGVNDLQVHVAVRDIQHLRDLIVDKFAGRTEVDHCETALIFGLYRKHQWPSYTLPPTRPASRPGTVAKRQHGRTRNEPSSSGGRRDPRLRSRERLEGDPP